MSNNSWESWSVYVQKEFERNAKDIKENAKGISKNATRLTIIETKAVMWAAVISLTLTIIFQVALAWYKGAI